MERAGLNPLPCFHYGDDIKYLKYYVEKYDYIALGGMVPIKNKKLAQWLDELFNNYLTDEEGNPRIKIHGFGLTAIPLIIRYPWYSVDSTKWVLTGRFGGVHVPRKVGGVYDYSIIPLKVYVSEKSPSIKDRGAHFNTMSGLEQKEIELYFKLKGFTFEELSRDCEKRDEINITYFLDLEKSLPKWPWVYKKNQQTGLGL